MAGCLKISIPTVIIEVPQYLYSKFKTATVLVGSLTLSGHQKGGGRAMLVQCSLI